MVDGVPVNHQYSKSLEFELLLADLVTSTVSTRTSPTAPPCARTRSWPSPGPSPDSPQYHATFCSCNTVFRQDAGAGDRWCGHCPEVPVRRADAGPVPRAGTSLTAIIGRDMFADPDQVPGFAALMSDDDKPFECVGERRESAVALRMLAELPGWRGHAGGDGPGRRWPPAWSPTPTSSDLLDPAPDLAFPDPDTWRRRSTGTRWSGPAVTLDEVLRAAGWRCGGSGPRGWPWSALAGPAAWCRC